MISIFAGVVGSLFVLYFSLWSETKADCEHNAEFWEREERKWFQAGDWLHAEYCQGKARYWRDKAARYKR